MRTRIAVSLVGMAVVSAGLMPAGAAKTVLLQMSNFRFCVPQATPSAGYGSGYLPCTPLDSAYFPNATGAPAFPGQYNPFATTTVHPGDTVIWVYRDTTGCDLFNPGCTGHKVEFAGKFSFPNRKTASVLAPARKGPITIVWTVPRTIKPGTTIPYFCPVNKHYQYGMTGALQVAA